MTGRQRLMAFLDGQQPDRTPVWLLFPYHSLSFYADVRNLPDYQPIWARALQKTVWLDRRTFSAPRYTCEVVAENSESVEDGQRVIRDTLSYKGTCLRRELRQGATGVFRKNFLACDDDLREYLEFPIERDSTIIEAALAPQVARWRSEAAEFPEHLGAMMTSLGEPVKMLHAVSKHEELSVWSVTASDQVRELLDTLMERDRIIYHYLLEQDVGDVYFMTGSELASPPMVSPETFRRWVVPYARELIAMVHAYGKKVIQHYHGMVKQILPCFITMGADALHTIEAPPTGNCTISEAFEIVGDRLGLIGNIQYDEFRRLDPPGMADAVRRCLDEGRGKRFMLSPTAGPFDSNPSPRVRDNYLQFIETGWQYGAQ